jgi:antitoxin (DNA-binding transcriptional repressor) of toxin-antitoxin stability system
MSSAVQTSFSVTEVENAPAAALRIARTGQVVDITSRGRAVVQMVPLSEPQPSRRAGLLPLREALAKLRAKYAQDLPGDPFEGLELRAKGKPHQVEW